MSDTREVLYAADIAKFRGISVRAARAWLATLEEQTGSEVRRVGNKFCISREAFDRVMPGGGGTSATSLEGRFKRLYEQVQAIARVVLELRESGQDHGEGIQSARRAIHELREAIGPLTRKSTLIVSPVESSA